MAEGEAAYLCLVVLTVAALLVVGSVHALAWFPVAVDKGLVEHTQKENWDFFELDILYVEWLLPIWIAVYALQIIWLSYSLLALCREKRHSSLVVTLPMMPTSLFFAYIPGLAASIGWLILFDMRGSAAAYSSVCMMASAVCFAITMAITLHALKVYEEEAKQEGFLADVWAIRILVQNGVSTYCAWAATVTCYTVSMAIFGFGLMEKDVAQCVALAVVMAYLLIWTLTDLFMTKYLTHFVLGPYCIFSVVFLMPILRCSETPMESDQGPDTHYSLSCVFMGCTVLIILMKLILVTGRCCCRSYKTTPIPDEDFCAIQYVPSEENSPSTTPTEVRKEPFFADYLYSHSDIAM